MKEEITELWKETPDTWFCPSCMRKKHECSVISKNGVTLKKLVEHHDHMRDYVKQCIKIMCGSWPKMRDTHTDIKDELIPYIDLIKSIAQRFPHTPVCMDCNEIEGKIKIAISADKYFSFSAIEIRRAYIPTPNERHHFLIENMEFYTKLYKSIENRLVKRRKLFIENLVNQALNNEVYWGRTIKLENIFDEDTLLRDFPPHLSSTKQKEAIQKGEPARYMAHWTEKETDELIQMTNNGISIEKIAKQLGRTNNAITLRLQKIGVSNNVL